MKSPKQGTTGVQPADDRSPGCVAAGPGSGAGQLVCAASAALLTHLPQQAPNPGVPAGPGLASVLQHACHLQGRPHRPAAGVHKVWHPHSRSNITHFWCSLCQFGVLVRHTGTLGRHVAHWMQAGACDMPAASAAHLTWLGSHVWRRGRSHQGAAKRCTGSMPLPAFLQDLGSVDTKM